MMWASWLAVVGFLAAVFLPPAEGGPSLFDQIIGMILAILPNAG